MNYNTQEIDQLINDWITFQGKMKNATNQKEEDLIQEYDMDIFDYIIEKLPRLALSIIIQILEQDNEKKYYSVLAAGELEDLLSIHGNSIINDIEALSKQNSNFKQLLNDVWQADMSDDIYERVLLAANKG